MSAFLFSGGVSTVSDVFGGWFKQEIEDLIFLLLRGMSSDADTHGEGQKCVFSPRVSSRCLGVCTTSSSGWKDFFFLFLPEEFPIMCID